MCPIGTKAGDFQGPAVIQEAPHRAAHDGNSHDLLPIGYPDGKFVPHNGLVVAVVLLYEGIGLPEGHRNKFEAFLLAHGSASWLEAAKRWRKGHHRGDVLIWGTFPPGAVKSIKPAILWLRGHTLLKVSSASGCLHIQSPLGPFLPQLFAVSFARPVTSMWWHSEQIGAFFFMPHPSL